MRLLLDTHVAVWSVLEVDRLRPEVLAAISDPNNEVAVSIVSLWEISVKNNLGRASAEPFGIGVAAALAEFRAAQFEIIAIDPAALELVEDLPRSHGDPFDRLLVATAMATNWQFMTRDKQLRPYDRCVVHV